MTFLKSVSENVGFILLWKGLWTLLDSYLLDDTVAYQLGCMAAGMAIVFAVEKAHTTPLPCDLP